MRALFAWSMTAVLACSSTTTGTGSRDAGTDATSTNDCDGAAEGEVTGCGGILGPGLLCCPPGYVINPTPDGHGDCRLPCQTISDCNNCDSAGTTCTNGGCY